MQAKGSSWHLMRGHCVRPQGEWLRLGEVSKPHLFNLAQGIDEAACFAVPVAACGSRLEVEEPVHERLHICNEVQ